MRNPTAIATAFALVAALAACGGTRAAAEGSASVRAASTVGVTVRNENSLMVNVYRVRSGTRFRLGSVSSFGTETFQLPEDALSGGTVQLMVDPIGSDEVFVTQPISVGAGQRVELKVGSQLSMSTHSVWNGPPAS